MKKILTVLLAFLVPAGGIFAQEWTFNGMVSSGIGLFFFTEDPEAMKIAPINNDASGSAPLRSQVDVDYVNSRNNAGLSVRIRAQGNAVGPDVLSAYFDRAYGWVSFLEDKLRFEGGRVNNSQFNTLDRMMSDDSGEGLGVLAIVKPIQGLTFGFGGYGQGSGNMVIDSNADGLTGGRTDNPQMRATFNMEYFQRNTFRIRAGLRTRSDLSGTGAIGHSRAEGQRSGIGTPSQAYISGSYLGTRGVHAALTARAMYLKEFKDEGDLRFYATVAFTRLVPNMGLHFGASTGMSMAERDESIHLWVWTAVEYEIANVITPRLDLHYVLGGKWNAWQRVHNWAIRDGVTFNEEDSFFHVRPSVQFAASNNSFLELGCILNFDIGDTVTWGTSENYAGLNIAPYIIVRVSF